MARKMQPYVWGQPITAHDRTADTVLTPNEVVGAVGPGEMMISPRNRPTGMLYVTDHTLLFVADSDYSPAVHLGLDDIHEMKAQRVFGNALLKVTTHSKGQIDFGVAAQVGKSAVAMWMASRGEATQDAHQRKHSESAQGSPPNGYINLVGGTERIPAEDLSQALRGDATAAWSLLDASRKYLMQESVQEAAAQATEAVTQSIFRGSGRNPGSSTALGGAPEIVVAQMHTSYGWGMAKCEESWGWAKPGFTNLTTAYALLFLPATMGLQGADALEIPDALTYRTTGYYIGRTT